MGTLVGHVAPGAALALLGLWHTINTLRSYFLNGPSKFRAAFWHPWDCDNPASKLKHIELVTIFSLSVLAIVSQIVDFSFFTLSLELVNLEHATMFLHLAVFSGFALLSELVGQEPRAMHGVVGVFAASVFGQELFLLRFHSADHVGIEGHYHWLLQITVLISFLASLAVTCLPSNLPSALALALSVVLQGCWFVNMGLMLWVPRLTPSGCSGDVVGRAMVCGSKEAESRARAVANLQFSWMVAGISVVAGCAAVRLAVKFGRRDFPAEYERLQSKGVEVRIAMNTFTRQSSPNVHE